MAGGAGLKPGARAVDTRLHAAASGKTIHLFEILRGTAHQLILFAGRSPARGVLEKLASIGKTIQHQYGDLVSVYLIVSADSGPAEINGYTAILVDPRDEAHARYGADAACLYLIRPEGYIGYRCRPLQIEHLQQYLAGIFRAAG